jgi:hypothetical protein
MLDSFSLKASLSQFTDNFFWGMGKYDREVDCQLLFFIDINMSEET